MEYTGPESVAASGGPLLAFSLLLALLVTPFIVQAATGWIAGFRPTYGRSLMTILAGLAAAIALGFGLGLAMGLIAGLMRIEISPEAAQAPQLLIVGALAGVVANIWAYQKVMRDPATGRRIGYLTAAKIYGLALVSLTVIAVIAMLATGAAPQAMPPA